MSEGNIQNIAKWDSKFVAHLLPDINYNGHCLIENNLSIAKKVINTFLQTKPTIKKFEHIFYIK